MREVQRPPEVTIVGILVWGEGLLYVTAGMIILVNLDDENLVGRAGGVDLAIPVAISAFVVALIFLGSSGGLFRGGRRARTLVTGLLLMSVVVAIYVISGGTRVLGGSLIALLAFTGLILLWVPRASRYFERGSAVPERHDRY